jgi:hypothetical protein
MDVGSAMHKVWRSKNGVPSSSSSISPARSTATRSHGPAIISGNDDAQSIKSYMSTGSSVDSYASSKAASTTRRQSSFRPQNKTRYSQLYGVAGSETLGSMPEVSNNPRPVQTEFHSPSSPQARSQQQPASPSPKRTLSQQQSASSMDSTAFTLDGTGSAGSLFRNALVQTVKSNPTAAAAAIAESSKSIALQGADPSSLSQRMELITSVQKRKNNVK